MTEADQLRLRWAVKSSLATYVEGAAGRITTSEPASTQGDEYVFPLAERRPGSDGERFCFSGEVRFIAHGGLLDLVIRDPWVHADRAGWTLSIYDQRATDGRVLLAQLEANDSSTSPLVFTARLTSTGAAVFDFNYPPGAELAPVALLGLAN